MPLKYEKIFNIPGKSKTDQFITVIVSNNFYSDFTVAIGLQIIELLLTTYIGLRLFTIKMPFSKYKRSKII